MILIKLESIKIWGEWLPYIKQENRKKFDDGVDKLIENITAAGELNYIITRLCLGYLRLKGKRYVNLNEIIGILECAKEEFYRRQVAPYEDEKIKENGDVE
jgi:hypothetical protein